MQQLPLDGVKVVDLTSVLAGPYCSYQLMLFGAEVVKVELPGSGDLARRLGPDDELNRDRLGASFLAQNAGKKSVELDLKDPDDRDVFEEMLAGADVLLENFRAGVLSRMGYDLHCPAFGGDTESARPSSYPRLLTRPKIRSLRRFGMTFQPNPQPARVRLVINR